MDETPNIALPYLLAAQAQKHVTHNEALRVLDAVVQLSVLDRNLATAPGSPSDGDRYIVDASPIGDWEGEENNIAAFQDNAWMFYPPQEGWLAWIADEDELVVWSGNEWSTVTGDPNPVSLVGVNATADTTNRLSISSPATLLNHEGAGHQLKLNKNTATDTGSLLFQTSFSGRAEMGLAGDDDFHVKVSPDGSTWFEALTITGASGTPRVPNLAKASLPAAATSGAGAMVYVSDESGGPVPAFSDGSNWRRVTDRAIIS